MDTKVALQSAGTVRHKATQLAVQLQFGALLVELGMLQKVALGRRYKAAVVTADRSLLDITLRVQNMPTLHVHLKVGVLVCTCVVTVRTLHLLRL